FHLLALLLRREREDPGVRPAVVAEFVPAPENLLDERLVLLDDEAGDEERRRDAVAVEKIENPSGADLPTVAALREGDRLRGVRRVAGRPERFGVEVEREHHGEAVRRADHGA